MIACGSVSSEIRLPSTFLLLYLIFILQRQFYQLRCDGVYSTFTDCVSDDALTRGDIGVSWTKGMQEGEDKRFVKVALTLKHYIANSVEGNWWPNGTWDPEGNITRHTIDVALSKQVCHLIVAFKYV